jgi:hypothetical protein
VILFPHSSLSEIEMRRIIISFGPMTIFQPWYMEPPPFALESEYGDAVRILNPPAHMKPGEGFKGLLSEYKTWIKQHRDKSSIAFLEAGQKMEPGENATWEIREALRGIPRTLRGIPRAGRGASRALRGTSRTLPHKREEQPALRWHLILHLARDIEEDHREADRMLQDLKDRGSPIEGLLGEEEAKNPLTDLSQFESDPQTMLYPIEPVIEAWLALFGGYLKGDERLLTLSRPVMDYASETWDTVSNRYENRVSKRLSGKNVILMEEELGA